MRKRKHAARPPVRKEAGLPCGGLLSEHVAALKGF